MAAIFDALTPKLISFIENQMMFFVGTAAPDGSINISPKGLDSLKVIQPNKLLWLNLTGSGNETAAHLNESNRMTIMFCSFDEKPLILRVYGSTKTIYPSDRAWANLIQNFPSYPGARQLFEVSVDFVQTSCGFAVPRYQFLQQRTKLNEWAEHKGKDGILEYWAKKNTVSLDGKPTGIKI